MAASPLNILLVEDDDVAAEAVIRSFNKADLQFPIILAEDGDIALNILRGSHERTIERPLLVLLDLNMPHLNGFEFLEILRGDEDLKDTVVFILTTSSDEKDLIRAYNENVAGYMVKSAIGPMFSKLTALMESYCEAIKLPQ
ncbi:response regulator [Thalassomonas actiniarum]|uniref:Response regulator n=1 Tax=Thalassomonas actiniarum TaxID=485447 RepID=A0AAE9YW18_9GAMM|nr:response regulator [Thalassomonas actiniarum]WDE00608.1 response regulator [Thalassomonas actiniarum]